MQGCSRSVGVEQAGSKPASIQAQASRVLPHKTNPKPIQFPIQLQRGHRRANRVCMHPPPHCPEDSTFNLPRDAGPLLTSMAPVPGAGEEWQSCLRGFQGKHYHPIGMMSCCHHDSTWLGWLYWLRWVSWIEDGSGDRKLCMHNGNKCFGS